MYSKKEFIDIIRSNGMFVHEDYNDYKEYICIEDFKIDDFEISKKSYVLILKLIENDKEQIAVYSIKNGNIQGYLMLTLDINKYFKSLREYKIEKIKLLWEGGQK